MTHREGGLTSAGEANQPQNLTITRATPFPGVDQAEPPNKPIYFKTDTALCEKIGISRRQLNMLCKLAQDLTSFSNCSFKDQPPATKNQVIKIVFQEVYNADVLCS